MSATSVSTHIVLLDDEPFMLKLLSRMLEQLGYRDVIGFSSGESALRHITTPEALVDLIFLDINMPEMDGVEFIRRLVDHRYRGSIILVSGEQTRILDSVQRLIEAHKLCSLGYLEKPVQPTRCRELMSRIKPNVGGSGIFGQNARQISIEELSVAVDNGEFVSHYQPIVSLSSAEVVGVESLLRWQDRTGRLIYPDQFISVAEEHGLIGEITRSVLASAMRQAKSWRQAGHELPIAVNVSMSDLSELDFPDVVSALADSVGIEPDMITLELTEGQVMRQPRTVLDVLSRLRLKRFRLAIDDFGTGHASLAQLRDLPFDELKIDRGFVHGAAANSTLQAICSASLRMAKQLRMQVIAEGVENEAEWSLLRDMGCDKAQGYLIARPMPAAELLSWMKRWVSERSAAVRV